MGLQGWGRKLLDTENSFPQREHSPHLGQRVLILHSSSPSWLHWGRAAPCGASWGRRELAPPPPETCPALLSWWGWGAAVSRTHPPPGPPPPTTRTPAEDQVPARRPTSAAAPPPAHAYPPADLGTAVPTETFALQSEHSQPVAPGDVACTGFIFAEVTRGRDSEQH